MKEFILIGILYFISTLMFSVGLYAYEKYKKDTKNNLIRFWKKLLIIFRYSAFSIIIIPIAIAKWAVDLTLDFKEE